MLIQIEAIDLPGLGYASSPDSPGGYHNVHVAVQRRNRSIVAALRDSPGRNAVVLTGDVHAHRTADVEEPVPDGQPGLQTA